jgi:hypothetical protein
MLLIKILSCITCPLDYDTILCKARLRRKDFTYDDYLADKKGCDNEFIIIKKGDEQHGNDIR